MKISADRFGNTKLRVASGLTGLAVGAMLATLAEQMILPYRGILCLAGRELLQAIPIGRLCEFVLASSLKAAGIFDSAPWLAKTASVIHLVSAIWKP